MPIKNSANPHTIRTMKYREGKRAVAGGFVSAEEYEQIRAVAMINRESMAGMTLRMVRKEVRERMSDPQFAKFANELVEWRKSGLTWAKFIVKSREMKRTIENRNNQVMRQRPPDWEKWPDEGWGPSGEANG